MLRVLTLNINYYVEKHGPWSVRKNLIRTALQSSEADIIALQAVAKDPGVEEGLDQATQLSRLLPEYRHVFFQAAATHPDGREEGSAILSRLPFAACEALKLTRRPNLDDQTERALLHARFDLPAGPLHLFNAHFSWIEEQTSDNLDQAIPYMRAFEGMGLLVGDLNTPSTSRLLERFRQAGWTDAWAELHPHEEGLTFESNQPSIRIDYAWLNASLKPYLQSIEIVKTGREAEGERLSDHLGLLASFSVGDQAQ
jgi:endonuclease/exonuclease/phosphatase family metal-dependent hydrolase